MDFVPLACLCKPGVTHSLTLHHEYTDVASDVGVNLCNVKSCLKTSNNEIFIDKRGDLPCVNILKRKSFATLTKMLFPSF